ncbi:MAG TPA: pilin [Candidatus Binatia bacterium]|nr:pilin [Candidatus Binatia bacterium]
MRRNSRGFTIIELMLAVTVVAILSALALPAYQSYAVRSKVAEAFVLVNPVKHRVEQQFQEGGSFPESNAAADLPEPATYAGKYVGSIEILAGGVVQVTFSDVALAGRHVAFTPAMQGASVDWTCASDLPASYLPATCR